MGGRNPVLKGPGPGPNRLTLVIPWELLGVQGSVV
jgi:hypothetical protein